MRLELGRWYEIEGQGEPLQYCEKRHGVYTFCTEWRGSLYLGEEEVDRRVLRRVPSPYDGRM